MIPVTVNSKFYKGLTKAITPKIEVEDAIKPGESSQLDQLHRVVVLSRHFDLVTEGLFKKPPKDNFLK